MELVRIKTAILSALTLVSLIAAVGCDESTEPEPVPAPPACPPTFAVATVTDLNFPGGDCRQATIDAQGQLDSGHYRRACQGVDPDGVQPPSVVSARVTDCRPTDGRGVFLDVEVCCPDAVEQAVVEPADVMRRPSPECAIRYTRTGVSELHYPEAGSCEAVLAEAENALGSMHYRKACTAAVPRATRERKVLEARVVECRSGGGEKGVSVDVELCCEAKVFEESAFKDLVWLRGPEEVRASIGEPDRIAEQADGVFWNYQIEVAREDEVFSEVTLVFVAGRLNSYSF